MKQFILMFAILALITSCKSQTAVAPLVIRDSISVTYKQGQEQPASIDAQGAATSQFLWNQQRIAGDNNRSCGAATRYDGKPKSLPSGGGAKSAESVESVRDIKIRVDTVFIERWHTQEVPSPPKPIPRFYRHCTIGFFLMLLFLLGSFGFRIFKAIYLKR